MLYRCKDKRHKNNLLKDKIFAKSIASRNVSLNFLGIALIKDYDIKEYISNSDLEIEEISIEQDYENTWRTNIKWKKASCLKSFDTVTLIPNLKVGVVKATVLTIESDRVVLLHQNTIWVAGKDKDMYRPYPKSRTIDLVEFAQKSYQ
jgi:hypothetical protein